MHYKHTNSSKHANYAQIQSFSLYPHYNHLPNVLFVDFLYDFLDDEVDDR